MTVAAPPAAPRRWRKPSAIAHPALRWGLWAAIALYLVWGIGDLEFDPERIARGLPRAQDMLAQMVPPDFARWDLLLNGLVESMQMAVLATALGAVVSVPIGFGAAANIAPAPLYWLMRAYIGISRTFPEVLIAIFLVKAFGFGVFAGVLTLFIASTGFVGKLLAEEVEAIDPGQVEAVRATGAGPMQVLLEQRPEDLQPDVSGLGDSTHGWRRLMTSRAQHGPFAGRQAPAGATPRRGTSSDSALRSRRRSAVGA
jgi:phosphonate transport system permease protein